MRPLDIMDLLKFMFQRSRLQDWQTIFYVSFMAGLIPLVTPVITETIFADIIPILDRQGPATVTQVAMVTGFTTAALSIVQSVALLRISIHADMAAEAALLRRILSLPTQFFRKFQSGDLASRMQGLTGIQKLISGESVNTVLNFLFGFWSLLLMCWYSLKLTVIAPAIWAIYMALTFFLLRRIIHSQRQMTLEGNKTAGILQQIFTGLAKFRMRSAESQAYSLWGKQFSREWHWNYAARWQKNYTAILTTIQPILLSLALYYFVFKDISEAASENKTEGVITYAAFLVFQAAYSVFNSSLATAVSELAVIRPLPENLSPILAAEPESALEKPQADILSGAMEVRHLSFSYGEGLTKVVNDLSFRIAAGEHVAIVGKSGCGKSTLVRLLLGFETPESGAVYYDGQDLFCR